MDIIISPAKQMKIVDDFPLELTRPVYLDLTEKLLEHLAGLTFEELKEVMSASDKITKQAYDNFQVMDLNKNLSPAILAYNGIQYKYMAPNVFTDEEYDYINHHLYILSGFYGIIKPFDGIVSYRLEMQAKCPFSLYEFWKDKPSQVLTDPIILNLASEEYAKCIRPYKPLIDVRFLEEDNGKLKEKGVYAKMARGDMVNYLASIQADSLEPVKQYNRQGYSFNESLSTDSIITFIRKKNG